MPTINYITVDRECVILLFVITFTMSMDVKAIIDQQIRLHTNNHFLSYFFPQLVIALCTKEGVKFSKGKVLLQPNELLTLTYIRELT